MLSPYDTPDFRSLFNSRLKNAAGKKRIESNYSPVQVPEGVAQVRSFVTTHTHVPPDDAIQTFVHFECNNQKDEAEKRFQYFTTKVGRQR